MAAIQPAPGGSPHIPADVREALDRFCGQLREAMPDRLVSVVLYGGLAKGEFIPQRSDINVLLVLKDASLAMLEVVAPILEQARRELLLNLLTLTEAEMQDSAEVFPIKFLDIQRYHLVLWGKDVASALNVPRERLRRQCARELMNLHLRLRQFYLERRQRPEFLESTLQHSLSTLLINLGLLIELKTGRTTTTKSNIIRAAAEIGFESRQLERFLALKQGLLSPNKEELKQLYGEFMGMVQRAVDLIDSL